VVFLALAAVASADESWRAKAASLCSRAFKRLTAGPRVLRSLFHRFWTPGLIPLLVALWIMWWNGNSAIEKLVAFALLTPLVWFLLVTGGRYLVKRFFRFLFRGLAGFGERPVRVVGWSIATVLCFAALFQHFGIVVTAPDLVQIDFGHRYFVNKDHNAVTIQRPINKMLFGPDSGLDKKDGEAFRLCLYYSSVTFTTLGYGDALPYSRGARICASVEAYSGSILMGLFLVTVFRRVLRS
jgi:hypothetical protein